MLPSVPTLRGLAAILLSLVPAGLTAATLGEETEAFITVIWRLAT
jgi:hypothetical protein